MRNADSSVECQWYQTASHGLKLRDVYAQDHCSELKCTVIHSTVLRTSIL